MGRELERHRRLRLECTEEDIAELNGEMRTVVACRYEVDAVQSVENKTTAVFNKM